MGKVRERGGGRDYLTFGDFWSYLTVGLLFGLTLPGVSAHGFLRGGGWGKGLYSSKTIQAILRERLRESERQVETDRRGERLIRQREEKTRREGATDQRRYGEIERKRRQTGGDRSRQIK